MTLVLGGGFGLYGHVAALASAGSKVATLARYRPLAEARVELEPLISRVQWAESEEAAIASATRICLARRPAENAALAHRIAAAGGCELLIIEKPIAAGPGEAMALEDALIAHRQRWVTPYLLLFCDWFETIARGIREGRDVAISWSHLPSPRVRNWKTMEEEGGGASSFYFIHCLALIEALMPGAAMSAKRIADTGEGEQISLVAANGTASLDIIFILGRPPGFTIAVDGIALFNAATPFGDVPAAGVPDVRIPVLQRFYRSAKAGTEQAAQTSAFHRAVTNRWAQLLSAGDA